MIVLSKRRKNMATSNEYRHDEQDRLQDLFKTFINTFMKGFSRGIVIYTGFKIIVALAKSSPRDRLRKLAFVLKNIDKRDCLRFSTFIGLYPSIFTTTQKLLKYLTGRQNGWHAAVAGGLAGLSSIIEDPSRRLTVSLIIAARSLGALLSILVARKHIPEVNHFDSMTYIACSVVITYCLAARPHLLPHGYSNSLLKWTRAYTKDIFATLYQRKGGAFISCQEVELHKYRCGYHAFWDLIHSWPEFAKLYLPIYLLPVLLFKRKRISERPAREIRNLLKNVSRSATFLAMCMMLPKSTFCLLRNLHHQPPPAPAFVPLMAGVASGLSIFFERSNRRKELAMFCLQHTLYVIFRRIHLLRIFPNIPHATVLLLSSSMSCIMYAFVQEPVSLSVPLKAVLECIICNQSKRGTRI